MSVSASVSTDISLIQPCGPPEIPCSMSITSLFLTGFFRTAPRNRLTFLHKTSGTAAPEKKFPASRGSATSGGAYSRSWLAGSAVAAMRVVGSPVRCTSRSWVRAQRTEGWKWISVAADVPCGHTAGLRRLTGETVGLTDEEKRQPRSALKTEYDALDAQYSETDELPDEVDQRVGEIEAAMAAFENRPIRYEPVESARAGTFVSIDSEGALRVERGFVPELRGLGALHPS